VDIDAAQRARREKRAQALKSRRRKTKVAKAEAEKARRSFITGRRFIVICVSASVIFFVGSSAFRIMDLKAQEEEAAKELKVKTEQKARLESELSVLKEKEYIEEQARERLGMVKQGEVLYVFEEKNVDGVSVSDKDGASASSTSDTSASDKGDASDADGADAQSGASGE
jgi:cell division protein FtsB